MYRQIAVYWMEYYLTIKKKSSTNTYYSMDEPCKHAKWKKQYKKSHILYNSFYIKFPDCEKSIDTNVQ